MAQLNVCIYISAQLNVCIYISIYTSEREGHLLRSWRGSRDGSGGSMGFSGSTNWGFLNEKGYGDDEGVVLHIILARNGSFNFSLIGSLSLSLFPCFWDQTKREY